MDEKLLEALYRIANYESHGDVHAMRRIAQAAIDAQSQPAQEVTGAEGALLYLHGLAYGVGDRSKSQECAHTILAALLSRQSSAETVRDAERYRWLRAEYGLHMLEAFFCIYGVRPWTEVEQKLDAAVDAAMRGGKKA